mgnify:CR=1 FL=1
MRRRRAKMVGMLEVSTGTDVAVARRRAVAEIKRAKAILSFTGSVDEASWAYLDELHGRALVAGAAELSEIQAVLTSENEAAVEYFGIRSVDQVEAFLERLEGRLTDEENVLYVPKVELDSLCTNYAPSAPTYRHLPPHCLFPIKPSGLRHHNPGPALLEADLYFDMATLWNALDQGQGRTVGEGGWLVDECVTLGRATIRAAFSPRRKARSRSTRWTHSAPAATHAAATRPGSSSASPTTWLARPPAMSSAGSSMRRLMLEPQKAARGSCLQLLP